MKARFIITIMAICSHLLVLGQTYNYAYVDGYKIKYGSGYYTSSGQYVHNGTIEEMGCFQTICPPAEVVNYRNYPNILVKSIGDAAFKYCTAANEIIINNGIETIGKKAFYDCENATSLRLSQSVKYILDEAFRVCSSLEEISCEANTPPSLGLDVFFNVDKSIPLYVPGWSISAYQSADQWKDFHNIQPLVFSGNYGDSICWKFLTVDSTISIYGHGQIPQIYPYIPWSQWKNIISHIVISEGITTISQGAFLNCSSVKSITCYAITPPVLEVNSFHNIDRNIPIYVPAGSISAYQSADQWKNFTDILPIGAQPVDVTTTTVTPSETTADIAWPQVTGAATYTIEIKKNGELICTLTFNAQGQLISIALAAPSRNNAPQRAQAAGFSFTVTSLDSGTTYSYTMTAKDNNGNVLETESGTFTTSGESVPTNIDQVQSDQVPCTKVVRDGQIFILRGDKTYTLQGQEVK